MGLADFSFSIPVSSTSDFTTGTRPRTSDILVKDFKQILRKIMYLSQTRTSVSVFWVLEDAPALQELAQITLLWTNANAHCLLEDLSLSQVLLPHMFESYALRLCTPNLLDMVLYLLATLIMVPRLEPRFEL